MDAPKPLVAKRAGLRIVVFGDPGMGKTTLALSFPHPLVIDTDKGLIAAALDGTDALVVEPNGAKDLEEVYIWCKDHTDEFDTIIIDSLDELVRLLTDQIVDEGKGQRSGTTITDLVPEQAEYLANQRQMHRILNTFRMLEGKHIVVTSGARERMGKRGPNVTPGLFTIVDHWSDVMAELTMIPVKEGDPPSRVLLTAPSPQREAKTRFAALAPYVIEPTFDTLWTLIQDSYTHSDRETAK